MSLQSLREKNKKLVIGLMSGTSVDGIDAALVEIEGYALATKVRQIGFVNIPFEDDVRQRILQIASGDFGGSIEISRMHMLLGQLYLDAVMGLCEKCDISLGSIDLIGSHGQTVYHQPQPQEYLGRQIATTLQIGDVSILCECIGVPVVSDFRVRDMAARGQGAPLVPYTEYLLYREDDMDVALQNIGGMGNITYIPASCQMQDLIAFDTGPGNVLIDAAVSRITNGSLRFDEGGKMAASGRVNEGLLAWLLDDEYLMLSPPKTTGREKYDIHYQNSIYKKADELGVSDIDTLATLTRYTAETICYAIRHHLPRLPERLVLGGGGSYNETLLAHIRSLLPSVSVLRGEDLGYSSDAKEAVAFAILANEAVHSQTNNAPSATGATHPVVMGKISQ